MKALIIVDIQNDFLPGGALAVEFGDQIIPTVNKIMPQFDLVVATQDWHPANHQSFASNQPHGEVGQVIDLYGLKQVLWPDHCIQDTLGASFADELNLSLNRKIFRKGTDPRVDSYSGFFDNGKKQDTGLAAFLQSNGISTVFIVGLATDYCVKYTALDAVALGFNTWVIVDAVKAVNLQPNDQQDAFNQMAQAGVKVCNSDELPGKL
ncbi:MAG: nicotinamidase [Cyclobacteriaceae bacterium]|nr:MAG: nicotinamidase [Cyclobacteriaceae bacterium]